MHDNIPLNNSLSIQGQNQSESVGKCLHQLYHPIQPDQSSQLEPSIGSPISDNQSLNSIKHYVNSKQIDQKQDSHLYQRQPKPRVKRSSLHSKSKTSLSTYSQFLDQFQPKAQQTQLKLLFLIIWHHILIIQSIFILIYIPIQYSFQMIQSNIYLIILIIINIFIYFNTQQLVNTQLISDQSILLRHFLEYIFLKDTLLVILLVINQFQINFEIDCIVIFIIIYLGKGKLTNLWRRYYQFKLDFYFENLFTLAIKNLTILNAITCFIKILEKRDVSYGSDDSFVKDYIASTQVSLSILTFNYQGDQEGIEIQLIAFFSLFLAVYLLHSFNIILSRQGIEIHSFFKSNNFDYVLREKLVSSINKQRYDSKIHFPQQLSDEIKVNQRLPLLLSYFKGYDTSHLKDIAINSEEITFYPSESIILKDVPDDCSIYFLLDGYAEIKSSSFVLQSISGPYVFGEMSFYTQQPRQASVVALTQCIILKVPREVMIAGLGQVEKELFHEQKDQISLNNKAPIECFCCKSNRHCIAQCNVFRIQINPEMLQSLNQTRCEYIRKMKKSLRIIPEQKYSKQTLSPSKTELKVQSKTIPFLYESNKSDPLSQPASICEQKSSKSIGILNDKPEQQFAKEKYRQQKQNQYQSVQEEEAEYSESFESSLNTNKLPSNWDVNTPQLYCESKISKIQNNFGENPGPVLSVPHTNGMSMSSFQDQATQIQDIQFTIIQDFDQCQLFSHYFPTGNFDIIIGQINKQKGLIA